MEYDYKRKLLVFELDKSLKQSQNHEFTLEATDKVGNTKIYKATFKF